MNTFTEQEIYAILDEVEKDTGMRPGFLMPAIEFDDDPDQKVYLLLLTYIIDKDNDPERSWTHSIGRQHTYDTLKALISSDCIDPNESFILAGKLNEEMDNAEFEGKLITVFRFMKVMYDDKKVLDDGEGFDINEYRPSIEPSDKTIITAG